LIRVVAFIAAMHAAGAAPSSQTADSTPTTVTGRVVDAAC
jgi:hypothetical protein